LPPEADDNVFAIDSGWSGSPDEVQKAKVAAPFSVKENGIHTG
jgi:hypothetical protein